MTDVIVCVTVINLTNAFFFIGLDRSRLTKSDCWLWTQPVFVAHCIALCHLEFFPYCLFVSNSQVIGCEDRLRNDLYCVGRGVKLYSIQSNPCHPTCENLRSSNSERFPYWDINCVSVDVCRLLLQLICFIATVTATNGTNSLTYWPNDIPPVTWAVSLVWPVVLIGLYELVKKREIK